MKNLISITIYTAFIALSVQGLSGCNAKKEDATATEKPAAADSGLKTLTATQFKNMNLTFTNLESKPMAEAVQVNGMVDVPPENVAKVSLPVTGFIKSFTHNVLPGKYVARGGVLAIAQSMEIVQMQQDYLEKFTQRTFLQQELERQKELAAEDATAKRKLQEAENNFRVNRALLSAYEAKLRVAGVPIARLQSGVVSTSLPIVSPISGFVKQVYINTGSNFSPSDVLFELVGNQHLHIELKVFEKDAHKIREGQLVTFEDPRMGGHAEGRVFLVGKNFEADTKAINVHVHLNNEAVERKLIPGQYIRAAIQTDARSANVLPESAFVQDGDKKVVYVLQKNDSKQAVFQKIPVQVGATANGFVEVLSPTNLKNVVTSRVTFLHGGGEEE